MSEFQLYCFAQSGNAYRGALMLNLIGADWEPKWVDFFGGAAEAPEGTIAPEGGCPGNFFTSRKWTFQDGTLLIRDHTGAQLAQLALVAPSRFEGKAANGAPITLAR